jgi:hypothetical protein
MAPLYQVRLLHDFKTDDKKFPLYKEGTWQHCYQTSDGFLYLVGKYSTWIFCTNAIPNKDFVWATNIDPNFDPRLPVKKQQVIRDLLVEWHQLSSKPYTNFKRLSQLEKEIGLELAYNLISQNTQ